MDTTEMKPRRTRRLKLTAGATAVVLAGSLGAVALFDNAGAAPGDNVKYTITLTGAARFRPPLTRAPEPRSSRSRARRRASAW